MAYSEEAETEDRFKALVEAARSELSKTRTLMVFRMYRVLTESQRTKLREWMREGSEAAENGEDRRRRC